MKETRIEIKLSKKKGILTFLGAVAFVVTSVWLIRIADSQERYDPIIVTIVGYAGLVFFTILGVYIFFKLFDTKPGLIIDNHGIYDNSSAAAGQMIRWERMKGFRVEQVASTRFILIDIENPEEFISQFHGIKKRLISSTYKMYGTPVSISTSTLDFRFEKLTQILEERLKNLNREGVK